MYNTFQLTPQWNLYLIFAMAILVRLVKLLGRNKMFIIHWKDINSELH